MYDLHGKQPPRALVAHQHDLGKGALTQDFNQVKILDVLALTIASLLLPGSLLVSLSALHVFLIDEAHLQLAASSVVGVREVLAWSEALLSEGGVEHVDIALVCQMCVVRREEEVGELRGRLGEEEVDALGRGREGLEAEGLVVVLFHELLGSMRGLESR